jgi:hypothetical protein
MSRGLAVKVKAIGPEVRRGAAPGTEYPAVRSFASPSSLIQS